MEKSTHTKEYAALRSELRTARETAGLSQRDLAGKLGVPHSWVAKVESGERRVDLIEFRWFLTACGADPIASADRIFKQAAPRKSGRAAKGARIA